MKKSLCLLLFPLLSGCVVTSEIVEIQPSVYSLSEYNEIEGSGSSVRNRLVKQGKDFCRKQGKTFSLENSHYRGDETEITFVCLNKDPSPDSANDSVSPNNAATSGIRKRYEIFQTLDRNNALARECEMDSGMSCVGNINKVVLLRFEQDDPIIYDGKLVNVMDPEIQDTYRYQTREKLVKTVPVILVK